MIGKRLDHYLIEARLGAGAMGVVYRAFDSRLERPVAIKLFPDLAATPKTRQRLMHEARSASALSHPNICTVFEVRDAGDLLYLVMELVDGRTLAALLPLDGFQVDTVLAYGSQIAGAVAHAHARGIIHRDLKSANVVVTPDGHVKVLDFGLAQRQVQKSDGDSETKTHIHDSMLSPGSVAGTPAYMPPEALRGQFVDGRADIWALGVMLHEMASGSLPFPGRTSFEVTGRILHEPPTTLPARVPHGLAAIIARCLAKDPGERYQDASEIRAALEAVRLGVVTPTGSAIVTRVAPSEKRSLVVLPFTNLSAESESDYFTDGLTEEIITDLSGVKQLRVISSTSSMQFKGSSHTVAELAQQLRVDYVLEGSVRRSGGALRITAKLIEAATDSPVWGNKYSGTLEDVFAIQETISRAIVEALRVVLTAEEDRKLKLHEIADVRAYEWYLRAKQLMLRYTKDSLDRAVECLDRSEAIAGENVLLLAAKGEVFWQYVNSGASSDQAYLDKAEACARRVLEIEPESPHGHRVAGLVRLLRGDIEGALRQLNRSLDQEPNDTASLFWGCIVAALSGKMPLAEAWVERLIAIDPVTPIFQLTPGTMAWFRGDYERAWALWSERHSDVLANPATLLIYGKLAVLTGRKDEGERILIELAHLVPDHPFAALGAAYRSAFAGDRERVLALLTPGLVSALEGDPQHCWFLGQCHALVNEVDLGIHWIQQAVSRGFLNYDLLARLDPFLSNLRGDPRFEALMRDVRRRADAIEV